MNCLSPGSAESTKSRKLFRLSPKNFRKQKTEKSSSPDLAMAGRGSAGGGTAAMQNGLHRDSELKQAFEMFDKNQDGKISSEELGGVLRTLGHDYTRDEVEDMIRHADTNENGYVEYDEFLVLMKRWSQGKEEEAAGREEDTTKETFKVFDMDGNGFIDRNELRYIMKRLGENLLDEDIHEMFKLADINGDGLIDYEEFTKLQGAISEGGLGGLLAGGSSPRSQQQHSHKQKSKSSSGRKK